MANFVFIATGLPHNIGMPDNLSFRLLFRCRNQVQGKITKQE